MYENRQSKHSKLQSFVFWGVGLLGLLLCGILVWRNFISAPRPASTWVAFDSLPVVDPYPELENVQIHINKASIEELMILPTIGEKRANAILEYRAIFGKINAPEQLLEIEGISQKTLDTILPYLVFD